MTNKYEQTSAWLLIVVSWKRLRTTTFTKLRRKLDNLLTQPVQEHTNGNVEWLFCKWKHAQKNWKDLRRESPSLRGFHPQKVPT